MLGILAWIMGLIAGLIAKALMPGRDPVGAIITTLLGIVGAPSLGASSVRRLVMDGLLIQRVS